MKSNTQFEAIVVVGIANTIAVVELTEGPAPGFALEEGELDAIDNDLRDCGSNEWWDLLPNSPKQEGTYRVKGLAYFDEFEGQYDSAEYERIDA